uniref:Uncharacterized protein n=1 Tax=blood disease bacterium R229 TaxID=741978 RepID=G2ZXU2_9RALS|nr:hypothetical protein BDB_mp80046 [blood disease bacterium R229]
MTPFIALCLLITYVVGPEQSAKAYRTRRSS